MKRIFLLFAFITVNFFAYSQLDHVPLLIGHNDIEIVNYFDSLNSLKSNLYYKTKKGVTDYGDLMYSVDFSLEDQKYYSCYGIIAIFQRFKGSEICVQQMVIGSGEYADRNLNFVKDNFASISDNKWEMALGDILKVVATFIPNTKSQYNSYSIHYLLVDTSK